jgi:predicted deacylase
MAADVTDIFRLGDVAAAPGQRSQGYIEVARLSGGATVGFPVIVVNGRNPGPTLCLNAGIHGDEFAGIEAAIRIATDTDPNELGGVLVVVPAVNVPSFEDAARVSHYDSLNLNRIFPGSPNGHLTQRIADKFLKEVVLKCTHMIDLHNSGRSRITPLVIAQSGYEEMVWGLATATGFDLIWLGGPWSGTGRISALEHGIPAITIEVGGGLESNPAEVDILVGAVTSVLRHLKMLSGEPDVSPEHRIVTGGMVQARTGGFFRAIAEPGQKIAAGETVAQVTNLFGEVIEEITADADGVVCMMRVVPSVQPGDEVCILGTYQRRSGE